MSRSRKLPWVKDKGTYAKILSNRMYRRKCRNILNSIKIDGIRPGQLILDELKFPLRREIMNQYDVCDWRSYRDDPIYRRK